MNRLDEKTREFLNKIFYDELEEEEYIRIVKANDFGLKPSFYTDVDSVISKLKSSNLYDVFFNLSTTAELNGKEEYLKFRYCLAYDFDLKDYMNCSKQDLYNLYASDRKIFDKNKKLLLDEIYTLLKSNNIYCHLIIDSGYGYHIYLLLNKTNDLEKITAVNTALQSRLNSDKNAIKSTQILRLPFTYNSKGVKPIKAKIVVDNTNKDNFKRYDIDTLYNRYCVKRFKNTSDITATFKYKNTPLCVQNALMNGSIEGNREADLYNIVIYNKKRGKSLEQIKTILEDWNSKNDIEFKEFEYQCEYVFKNCNGYLCNNCDSALKLECKNYTLSNFNLEEDGEPIIIISNKVAKDIKYRNRKGVKMLLPNELFIYNVLLNNKDIYLTREGILKLITDRKTKKVALSERTLKDTLKGLVDKGYIRVVKGAKRLGIADTYKINSVNCKAENEIKVTYFLNLAVIWGRISTEELHLYTYMRYLHHQEVTRGKAKGNIFTVTMEELAKELGITQPRVTQMIDNLYKNNILDRRAIPIQGEGNRFYYQYKLNK